MMSNLHGSCGRYFRRPSTARRLAVCLAWAIYFASLAAADEPSQAAARQLDLGALSAKVQEVVQHVKPACVAATERRRGRSASRFSAVIVSREGHVLTAGHCIRPGADYQVTLEDGRVLAAKSLGRSDYLDCGMMKIVDTRDLPWVELGNSSELARNQPCLSLGHPSGPDTKRGQVVRFGRVVGRNGRGHIHNTCLMEPGDSGGGLFDLDGRLIGIHSYINKSLEDNFDIPVDDFRDHWEQLSKSGEFTPLWAADRFGIGLRANRATERGAEVVSVLEGSPVAIAGLQVGDMITKVNDSDVHDEMPIGRVLQRMMGQRAPNMRLTVRRNEKLQAIVIPRHVPKSRAVSGGDAEEFAGLAKPQQILSEMEAAFDDCVVRIISRRGEAELSVLGTVLSQDGLVVTKGSRVGTSVKVLDEDGRPFSATIVASDPRNDLVLLQADHRFARIAQASTASEPRMGAILLTPGPGTDEGLVSVVGSESFASTRQKQFGYMGVYPIFSEDHVMLESVAAGAGKRAGLLANDVIVSVDDMKIKTVDQLIKLVQSYDPGYAVRVTIERADARQTLSVTLGERPSAGGRHIANDFEGGRSLRYTGFEEVFCHDAHTEPDQCGGPLFDVSGSFVGITVARVSRTHCYAVPATVVLECLRKFIEEGKGPAA